jgi:hypothetical protein
MLGATTSPRADTHFRIASNTKTMTAAVIVQLAQEAKLSLGDPISKYVPGVPNGDNITIAELLDMRSGLYNYTDAPELWASLDRDPTRAWTPDELLTLGRLFELSHNYDEAARNYYAMYAAAGADNAAAETALASLTRLLLSLPEQPIRFGASNLALYRDVATMDPHPGFLNGILSLILNNTDPAGRYADEERDAGPYFRRAKAAELVALFESRFPTSPARTELRERLIDAYAVHGSGDGVIRAGTSFLADFPNVSNRAAVALRMADAYARQNQTPPEFARVLH